MLFRSLAWMTKVSGGRRGCGARMNDGSLDPDLLGVRGRSGVDHIEVIWLSW